jgi:hypothetical protein
MQRSASPHSRVARAALGLLLLAAQAYFLWTFFSAESIPLAAAHAQENGRIHATFRIDPETFAAQWKHGMTGDSPIYMPGFFVVGLITWLWALGRPMRRLAVEWLFVTMVAAVLAYVAAPLGAVRAVGSYERAAGVSLAGPVPAFSAAAAAVALFTLVTWNIGIYCLQQAVARRSFVPMIIPVVLNLGLIRVRPGAFIGYTSRWLLNLSVGDPVAVVSVAAIPTLLAAAIAYQLRAEGNRIAGAPGPEDSDRCAPFRTL